MTSKDVFNFSDYKGFLKQFEKEKRPVIRGFRSRLAENADCNNAFISQVLNTSAHFSLEQGIKIAEYLDLNSEEKKYFILLLEFGRAGTKELKSHFINLINEMQENHLNIKGRVKHEKGLSTEAQSTYYSQWYFSAIHILVTIPHLRTIPEIGRALRLKVSVVEKAISFLLSVDLIIEKSGKFFPGPSYLHLEKNSPNIPKHHTNWRMSAINSLQNENKGDVHYSTVSTLSRKDAEVIRARFVQNIQEYVEQLTHSSEETMYCFNLDFFKVLEE